jgi:hypothetical protein
MSGAEPRASFRGLFRKLEILPVPCQYILSLMLFIIDKPNNFRTVSEIHGLHTRSNNFSFKLQISQVSKNELTFVVLHYITVCSAVF